MPLPWRWATLAAIGLLAVLLIWLFFLRNSQGGGGSNIPGPLTPRPAVGQVITRQRYATAVESALSDVRAAKGTSGDERKKSLEKAARTLEGVEGAGILSAPGSVAIVDNTAIIEAMRAGSPEVESVESSLTVLDESLREEAIALLPGTARGDKAGEELKAVLSDPAFNYERELSPLQRLVRWLSGITGEADPGDTLWRWFSALVAGLAAASVTYLSSG